MNDIKHEETLLQKIYIQKSKLFLLPLSEIRRDPVFRPSETYVASPDLLSEEYPSGISIEDNILITKFPRSFKEDSERQMKTIFRSKLDEGESSAWEKFELSALFSNKNFIGFHEVGENYIYTFDLSKWKSDWKKFMDGRYSLFTERAKDVIVRYRGNAISDIDKLKLQTYLYPNKESHLRRMAQELQMDVDDLRIVKELCNPPDMRKEVYKIITDD